MIKKIINPTQDANNVFSFTNDGSPCCGDTYVECGHKVTFPNTETFVSFIVVNRRTGANQSFAITGEVRQSIANTLVSIGYAVEGVDSFYMEDDGTNIIFGLFGDLDLISVTTNVGVKTPVKACNKVLMCNYTFAYAGNTSPAVSTFSIDGVETVFGASLVWDTASASTVRTAFNTPAAAGGAVKTTVTLDEENEKYLVTIRAVTGTVLLIDGEEFTTDSCWTDFI